MLDSETAVKELAQWLRQWWSDALRESTPEELAVAGTEDLAQLLVHQLQVAGGLSPDNPVPLPEGWEDWGEPLSDVPGARFMKLRGIP